MTKTKHDIQDDEIRVISSRSRSTTRRKLFQSESTLHPMRYSAEMEEMECLEPIKPKSAKRTTRIQKSRPQRRRRKWIISLIVVGILIGGWLMFGNIRGAHETIAKDSDDQSPVSHQITSTHASTPISTGYVDILDTVVNGNPLTVMTPHDAIPRLHVGADVLADTTAVLVAQAADTRADNGGIVGAYVSGGQLLSRGQSKAGFCAIIDGVATVGVADASPYLERAIESGGYFFRQYPLVVAGQVVENKPRGKSFRKALADWKGQIVIVMSDTRLTFHEFSQTLVDLGVTNAIYLVGSTSFGFARDKDGNKMEFGKKVETPPHNANYIAWY